MSLTKSDSPRVRQQTHDLSDHPTGNLCFPKNPSEISKTLRQILGLSLYSIFWMLRYPGTDTHGLNENNYYTYGFLWVQDLVDRAIINFQTGRNVQTPGLYIQKFPAPCYDNDVFAEVIEHGMPLFMLLSWIYFSSVLVNAVAKEKETRLKEVRVERKLETSKHNFSLL